MHFNSPPLPHRIDPFMRLGFDIDPVHPNSEHLCDAGADRFSMLSNLGPFANNGCVQIHHSIPSLAYPSHCLSHKHRRICRFMSRVGIGEQLSNISLADRSQECIRHRMKQRVGV